MGFRLPLVGSRVLESRMGNREWKTGWSSWVMFSTMIAVVVHLVVFIVIPNWEIVARRAPSGLRFVQIDPLISVGGQLGVGDEAVSATPEIEIANLEIEIQEGEGSDTEADLAALIEIFGLPSPRMSTPLRPQSADQAIPPPTPPLDLQEVIPLTPRIAFVGPPVVLPVIRNPTVLQSFLRRRYNPVHEGLDHNGYVSVAMWIDERGAVEWTAVSASSGSVVVDDIALAVFNDVALFTPARSEGRRVPVSLVISVPFTSPW